MPVCIVAKTIVHTAATRSVHVVNVDAASAGVQLLECLSEEAHRQHGGELELQAAAAIPALLHMTPPAPAAAPCATMDTPAVSSAPTQRYPVPLHLQRLLPGAADATFAWPLVAPALPAHHTSRCTLVTDKAHADVLTLRLPPYAATLPTASLPLIVRLTGRVVAVVDALAARRGGSGARDSESDGGLDAWGSMIPGASVPSTHQRRPLELLVSPCCSLTHLAAPC